MTGPAERTPGVGEQAVQTTKPALIDFVTLTPDEKLAMQVIKISRQDEEPSLGLEINKTRKIAGTDNEETIDSLTVSQETLDRAREWIYAQPYKGLPREEYIRLYGITRQLSRISDVMKSHLPSEPSF